jgi:uncharacterized protein (TIGR02466 family)
MSDQHALMQLFSVPVYISKISLDENIKNNVASEYYEEVTAKNGFMTSDKKLLHRELYKNLKEQIENHVQEYAMNIYGHQKKIEFYMTTSWAMKHEKGNFSHPHSHANSIISGIVYIDCNEYSGRLNFIKLFDNLGTNHLTIDVDRWNPFNSKSWSILPEIGNIVIFPSNIPHSVDSNESDSTRFCIAFNYFVKGSLGQNEGELIFS